MRENADQINSKYRRILRSVQDVLQVSIILQTGSRMSEIQAASVQSDRYRGRMENEQSRKIVLDNKKI